MPSVELSPSTYADLLISPNPDSHPSLITRVNTRISKTTETFKIIIGPSLITQIGNYYQVQVSLESELGQRGPYLVDITVINTPPKFKGRADLSVLGEV